ncbi:MAG: hypothetical protein HC802_01785 [Caldilineaceae bacterium]|nr:hypothetical protein [Caldilineaceae bacterium]
MTSTEAADVLEFLAKGIDPTTGEVVAEDNLLHHSMVVRALFMGRHGIAREWV